MQTPADDEDPVNDATRFGVTLRALRLAAGMSLNQLAAAAHYSKSQLSKVENGYVRPNAGLARACDLALGSGDTLRDLVPPPARRRTFTLPGFYTGLPRETRHFVGRSSELDLVIATLTTRTPEGASPAICVVHGMAGVGKTALAVRAAWRLHERFPDGQLFLDLHGHTPRMRPVEPADALDRCLRRLGVGGEHIPRHPDDRAGMFRERVAGRQFLLILDNAGTAAQVEPLLPATSTCAVLITSRHRLAAIDDAVHVGLDVLPEPEAVSLLHALSPEDPAPDGVAATIVRRCGRLPLAIRMAAPRVRGYRDDEPAALTGLLDNEERPLPALFATSVRVLTPGPQEMFTAMAQHPGADFDTAIAAAATATPVAVAGVALDRLCDANLLLRGENRRFRFHDLVREYAVGLLDPPAAAATQRRLADFYLVTADGADRLIAPHRYHRPIRLPDVHALPDPALNTRESAHRWLTAEFDNLLAVCRLAGDAGLDEHCWRIAHALQGYSFLTKSWDSWASTHETGLAAARRLGDVEAEGYLLNGLGLVSLERHDSRRAGQLFRAAYARFDYLGDARGLCNTLGNWAWLHHYLGDHDAALGAHRHALRFQEESGAEVPAAVTLRGIALAEVGLGRFSDAAAHLTRALRIFDEHDLPLDRAMALNCLGETHLRRGATRAAARAYESAIDASESCGSRYELARGLEGLAAVLDDPAAAHRHLLEASRLYGELGAPEASRVRSALAAWA